MTLCGLLCHETLRPGQGRGIPLSDHFTREPMRRDECWVREVGGWSVGYLFRREPRFLGVQFVSSSRKLVPQTAISRHALSQACTATRWAPRVPGLVRLLTVASNNPCSATLRQRHQTFLLLPSRCQRASKAH